MVLMPDKFVTFWSAGMTSSIILYGYIYDDAYYDHACICGVLTEVLIVGIVAMRVATVIVLVVQAAVVFIVTMGTVVYTLVFLWGPCLASPIARKRKRTNHRYVCARWMLGELSGLQPNV